MNQNIFSSLFQTGIVFKGYQLTERILGLDGLLSDQRIRCSKSVHSLDAELVLVTRSQTEHFSSGLLSVSLSGWAPATGCFVQLFDRVVIDRTSTVIIWWFPVELTSFGVHFRYFEWAIRSSWLV